MCPHKKLNKIQRITLIRLCKACRTAPTAALQVIAGVLPLHIRAKEVMWNWYLGKNGITYQNDDEIVDYIRIGLLPNMSISLLNRLVTERPLPHEIFNIHPAKYSSIAIKSPEDKVSATYTIFTNGSKQNDKVGAAYVIMKNKSTTPIYTAGYRLESFCTVPQAELYAIFKAVNHLSNMGIENQVVRICSDSQTAIQKLKNPTCYFSHMVFREIQNNSNSIVLTWVKGHAGLAGNEAADKQAKLSANSSSLLSSATFPTPVSRTLFMLRLSVFGRGNGRMVTLKR
ncbi:uncharacterized protein [Centruroides vittatus]|uniref:uncharacterized protein n=1 Tax=Centruroides vittatus TaxID=120091 RepID=UPI003510B352